MRCVLVCSLVCFTSCWIHSRTSKDLSWGEFDVRYFIVHKYDIWLCFNGGFARFLSLLASTLYL